MQGLASRIFQAETVSSNQNSVQPRAEVMIKAGVAGCTGPQHVHLDLRRCIPAIVVDKTGRPQSSDDGQVTQAVLLVVQAAPIVAFASFGVAIVVPISARSCVRAVRQSQQLIPLRVIINFTTGQADDGSEGENSRVDMLALAENGIADGDVGGSGSTGSPRTMELF